jgi:uncharacterized membrane protein YkvA (DUF1232 family)
MGGNTKVWLLVAFAAVVAAVMVVIAVRLCVRLVRTRRLLTDAGVPVQGKLAFWAAIVYLVCPVDLLPDPILIDDIAFLLLALRSLDKAAARAGIHTLTERKPGKGSVGAPPVRS